nr:hypothetical protein [Tanacetum cinerariifolium]
MRIEQSTDHPDIIYDSEHDCCECRARSSSNFFGLAAGSSNEDLLKQWKELQDGFQNQANRRIAERGNGHVSEDDVTLLSICYLGFYYISWYQEPKFLFKKPPRRSEGEELKYPFFKGDGSSFDEWRDYGVTDDDYEGPLVFDDDQYEEELMPVYDTAIEDVIEEEKRFVGKGGFGGE